MNVAVVIATHGGLEWAELAWERAYPSIAGALNPGRTQIWIEHYNDLTVSNARNKLAQEVDEEYDWLCFLDADDELGPNYFYHMAAAIKTHGMRSLYMPAVSYTAVRAPDTPPTIPNLNRPIIELNHGVIGTLVPRTVFNQVGGFRDLPIYEDWDLWLRCMRAGCRVQYVKEAVYRAYASQGRNSQSPKLRQKVYWQIRNEHAKYVGEKTGGL